MVGGMSDIHFRMGTSTAPGIIRHIVTEYLTMGYDGIALDFVAKEVFAFLAWIDRGRAVPYYGHCAAPT